MIDIIFKFSSKLWPLTQTTIVLEGNSQPLYATDSSVNRKRSKSKTRMQLHRPFMSSITFSRPIHQWIYWTPIHILHRYEIIFVCSVRIISLCRLRAAITIQWHGGGKATRCLYRSIPSQPHRRWVAQYTLGGP